jgi:hypothetical protein
MTNINRACAPSQADDVASRRTDAASKSAGQSLTPRYGTPQGNLMISSATVNLVRSSRGHRADQGNVSPQHMR